MELVHEYCEEIVMINDSFSEEIVHASKGQYCLDNENFIDVQGVAGLFLKSFAQINKCVQNIVQSRRFHKKMRSL